MQPRILVFSLVVIAGPAPMLAAQAPALAPGEMSARTEVYQFNRALQTAVEVGGQRLAAQAKALVPDIILTPSEQPIVRGVKLEGYGFHFDVQVPNIDKNSMAIFDMFRDQPQSRSRGPVQPIPSQPVSRQPGQPVSSTRPGIPVPEPPDPLGAFEADKEYGARVKEALLDAMIDNSAGLTIAATDKLTLSVSAMDVVNSRPLLIEPQLLLTISGADLLELRSGRINREQAKARIQVSSF